MSKADLLKRIARWVIQLEDFDYSIQHRSGVRMKHVDALSRCVMQIDNSVSNVVKECQLKDDRLSAIRKVLEKQPYEDYIVEGGVLLKILNGKKVIVLPEAMQTDVLRKVHDNGHFGVQKMAAVIQQDYFIPKS